VEYFFKVYILFIILFVTAKEQNPLRITENRIKIKPNLVTFTPLLLHTLKKAQSQKQKAKSSQG
jgi:hypothetical protein